MGDFYCTPPHEAQFIRILLCFFKKKIFYHLILNLFFIRLVYFHDIDFGFDKLTWLTQVFFIFFN